MSELARPGHKMEEVLTPDGKGSQEYVNGKAPIVGAAGTVRIGVIGPGVP